MQYSLQRKKEQVWPLPKFHGLVSCNDQVYQKEGREAKFFVLFSLYIFRGRTTARVVYKLPFLSVDKGFFWRASHTPEKVEIFATYSGSVVVGSDKI